MDSKISLPVQATSKQINKEKPFSENRIGKGDQKFDPFLSPKQAAEYLSVSVKLIYERIARKELDSQPVGRLRRIRLSALETWLSCQKQGR